MMAPVTSTQKHNPVLTGHCRGEPYIDRVKDLPFLYCSHDGCGKEVLTLGVSGTIAPVTSTQKHNPVLTGHCRGEPYIDRVKDLPFLYCSHDGRGKEVLTLGVSGTIAPVTVTSTQKHNPVLTGHCKREPYIDRVKDLPFLYCSHDGCGNEVLTLGVSGTIAPVTSTQKHNPVLTGHCKREPYIDRVKDLPFLYCSHDGCGKEVLTLGVSGTIAPVTSTQKHNPVLTGHCKREPYIDGVRDLPFLYCSHDGCGKEVLTLGVSGTIAPVTSTQKHNPVLTGHCRGELYIDRVRDLPFLYCSHDGCGNEVLTLGVSGTIAPVTSTQKHNPVLTGHCKREPYIDRVRDLPFLYCSHDGCGKEVLTLGVSGMMAPVTSTQKHNPVLTGHCRGEPYIDRVRDLPFLYCSHDGCGKEVLTLGVSGMMAPVTSTQKHNPVLTGHCRGELYIDRVRDLQFLYCSHDGRGNDILTLGVSGTIAPVTSTQKHNPVLTGHCRGEPYIDRVRDLPFLYCSHDGCGKEVLTLGVSGTIAPVTSTQKHNPVLTGHCRGEPYIDRVRDLPFLYCSHDGCGNEVLTLGVSGTIAPVYLHRNTILY